MKKLHITRLTAAVLCVGLLFACQSCKKKNEAVGPGPNTAFGSGGALLKSWAPEADTFTVNAATGDSITVFDTYLDANYKKYDYKSLGLRIQPGSLISGTSPVSGSVEVIVTCINSKRSMISSGIFACDAGNKLFEPSCLYKLSLRQGSKILGIDPAKPIKATMYPAYWNTELLGQYFSGQEVTGEDVAAKWTYRPDREITALNAAAGMCDLKDTGYFGDGSYEHITRWSSACSDELAIQLPDGADPARTSVYVLLKHFHMVIVPTYYDASATVFKTKYCLPFGNDLRVLCVTVKDNNLCYSLTEAGVIYPGSNVRLNKVEVISETDLSNYLEAF